MDTVGVVPGLGFTGGACADEADRTWFAQRARHWSDDGWWQSQIDAALAGTDPVICNLRITLVHQELSLALSRFTGPETGANFHTWAMWGSKTAGRTIRQEDLRFLPRAAGILLGWGVGGLVNQAARRIYGGNATVLEDIGRQSARFLGALSTAAKDRNGERLEGFLAGLRPGAAGGGGQDLLRGAYRHYYDASREADRDRRDELMLCANLLAILHEHERLDPYIDSSVPRPLRRFVTRRLLSFSVGAEAMKVSVDVPTRGPSPFPDTLATIEDPELESLLCGPHGWDRTPNTTVGSGAGDWTRLSDRMNFIVDLFRTRQKDPNLFTPPYSHQQRDAILAGRLPDGPL